MNDSTEFRLVERTTAPAAVVSAEVAMDDLPDFFGRAFGSVMQVLARQGVAPTGPPFGLYPRMPADTVAVVAGFPTEHAITSEGDVTAFELPAGRAVTGVHVGSYDSLEGTYGRLLEWVADQGLEVGHLMWESYLSDPEQEPDPSTWRTEIVWPLADSAG